MKIQSDPRALSQDDRERLQTLEQVIHEGLETFIRVGRALREIHDRRLYRASHGTFEDYCRERFGIGRHYAYRQIRGAGIAEFLRSVDSWQQSGLVPANEAQARPLTSLEPEEAREAWGLALELAGGGQPTSGDVQKAVDLLAGDGPGTDGPDASVHFSSKTDQWMTPSFLVERVEEVLGRVTLDPCAASRSSPVVPAETHFTEAEDGLSRSWAGRVFMNPPYGREIVEWIDKLVGEYEDGEVSEAIALLPSRTDTLWFRRLRPYLRCFLHGRLTFSGHENTAPFPSMTVYMGPDDENFMRVFSELGDIYAVAKNGDG